MHLLAAEPGRIDDGDAAVDLGQSPGDIVILSSADSELAALSAAAADSGLTFRLANLMRLAHPLSVDLYLEKTVAAARLVVVRMMGGAGYWPYGLERVRALSRGGGPRLVVVPGEDRWDEALQVWSSEPTEECRLLWRYFVEGGAGNASRAVAFMAHLLGAGARPEPPLVLPHAGAWWPGEGAVALDAVLPRLAGRPVAALVFYRALIAGGSTAPIDALVQALADEGIAALPLFVASLKDRESEAFLTAAFAAAPPAIVLNTTAFAVARIGAANEGTVLDRPGRPVLQVVLAGSTEEAWRASPRGLLPRDLTMNVVLPEVDGRILTRAVSFKAESAPDPRTEARAVTYRPVADRVALVARQVSAWVKLAAMPAQDRRVAIVLSHYPNREGRLANGVGLDTPASAVHLAAAMAQAGYDTRGFPESSADLMARLLGGRNAGNTAASLPLEGRPEVDRPQADQLPGGGTPVAEVAPPPEIFVRLRHPQISTSPQGGGWPRPTPEEGAALSLADYLAFLDTLPPENRDALTARWGPPESDPQCAGGAFPFRVHRFGNAVVAIQPSRGYDIDPKASYHDPALVPPHNYLAFYAWLRLRFRADAVVQLGKHGNLEWLPGKALGLSGTCWPEVALGAVPLVYPFIVNDPGEGSQAKRRSSAVIVDHLMPAMTRAEIHGPLAELETLIDEYYLAAGIDPRRRAWLETEIVALAARHGLDRDLGIGATDAGGALRALDAHLCELKEMQIRDGLHTLGAAPAGRQRIDTLVAIARVPRAGGRPEDQSLHRAIATDLGLAIDPLDCAPAADWTGPRPAALAAAIDAPWRSAGDTVERVELLAAELTAETLRHQPSPSPRRKACPRLDRGPGPITAGDESIPAAVMGSGPRSSRGQAFRRNDGKGVGKETRSVLAWIAHDLAPALDRSGEAEVAAALAALDGRFVPPGPSGAPTRGRADVLPTGRNFYSVDVRAVPTRAAWALGRAAAEALALRYFEDEGEWPRSIAMSAWGTSNMRTGGDDIAEVLALIGAEPVWEAGTGRVTGFKVIPLSALGRPRIDVTLKISGMFRDSFPDQIDLIDSAMRAIAALDEDARANPLAGSGHGPRIFGAKAGAYGAGLQIPIDEGLWETRADLAESFLAWGSFAYGGGRHGEGAREAFAGRLKAADAVLHNQDNREHDILDSDDYYQFQGGFSAAIEALKGATPRTYHGDHSRPEKPVVRPLAEEIARVVRGRAANPKWIAGMMRHGYKGAFEMAATVDYLFAFAATTDAVGDHHFDALYDAYLGDPAVAGFIEENNPPALREIAARFREAVDRGLWSPRLNSAYDRLSALIAARREAAE